MELVSKYIPPQLLQQPLYVIFFIAMLLYKPGNQCLTQMKIIFSVEIDRLIYLVYFK